MEMGTQTEESGSSKDCIREPGDAGKLGGKARRPASAVVRTKSSKAKNKGTLDNPESKASSMAKDML